MNPDTIIIDNVKYTVYVELDSEGEIYYFQLIDPEDELFFECDWQGGFTEEDVLKLL